MEGDQRSEPASPDQVWISPIYGVENDEPFVQMIVRGKIVQMTPSDARNMAKDLMEAAASSEIDAVCYRFGRDHLGSLETGKALVDMLREYRGYYKNTTMNRKDDTPGDEAKGSESD